MKYKALFVDPTTHRVIKQQAMACSMTIIEYMSHIADGLQDKRKKVQGLRE